jgi:hypothetical protein
VAEALHRAREAAHEAAQAFEQGRRASRCGIEFAGQERQQPHRMAVPVDDFRAALRGHHALDAQGRISQRHMLQRRILQREKARVLHRIGDLQHEAAPGAVDEEVLVPLAHQFPEAARDAVVTLQQAECGLRAEGRLGGLEDGNLVHGAYVLWCSGRATSPRNPGWPRH